MALLMGLMSSCAQLSALIKRVEVEPVYHQRHEVGAGYKICAIGDTGTGKSSQYTVANALASEGCDEVRILGDIIYEHGLESVDDPQYVDKFEKPYRDILEDTPFYLGLGNHDWNKGKPDTWVKKAKEHRNVIFPSRYYADKYALEDGGSLCIVTLALTNNHKNQAEFLKDIKKQSADCKIAISSAHYPYLSVGKHGDAKFLIKKFLKKNIVGVFDLHLAGHDHHLSYEGTVDGTHLVVSGAGAKLRPLGDNADRAEFAVSKLGYVTVLLLENGNVQLDYITVDKNTKKKSKDFTKVFTPKGFK